MDARSRRSRPFRRSYSRWSSGRQLRRAPNTTFIQPCPVERLRASRSNSDRGPQGLKLAQQRSHEARLSLLSPSDLPFHDCTDVIHGRRITFYSRTTRTAELTLCHGSLVKVWGHMEALSPSNHRAGREPTHSQCRLTGSWRARKAHHSSLNQFTGLALPRPWNTSNWPAFTLRDDLDKPPRSS